MKQWNPWEDLNALQEQINQVFDNTNYQRRIPQEARARERGGAWAPPVEAWETESAIMLSADLPGTTIEDIDLQIEGDQLIVKGERKPSEEKRNYKRSEKLYGPFFRAFSLTTPIDRENVKASYKNGVLEVTLPKSEAIKPKQIKIVVEE